MSFYRPALRTATSLTRCRFCMSTNMPLKAKITNPAFTRGLATTTDVSEIVREQPGDEADDVLFSQKYGLRSIELNRPKKLNSLNGSMARKIIGRLKEWEKSDLANVIVISGAGRAFCAGGDVAALAIWDKEGPKGQARSNDYFALEYKLDHLIATYPKPYIAYMDGITMGGGVGLSVHAPFRIATENTVFAMPETTIGFYPEVGASFFLPRMDGRMGAYLALTSEQLKGVDVFYHGIATHFIHSTSLSALSDRLAELQFHDYSSKAERLSLIAKTLAEFETGLPAARAQISGPLRSAIDACFSHQDPLQILKELQTIADEKSNPEDLCTWATKTIKTIRERSPTGVSVALKQMEEGKTWNIAQAFRKEHSISSHFMGHPDFAEGVTARLISRKKERPNWQPNTLEEVTAAQVDKFFGPPTQEAGGELALLESGSGAAYMVNPFADLALPTEREIVEVWNNGRLMKEEVVQRLVQQRGGKVGVREKVEEVVERKQWEKERGM